MLFGNNIFSDSLNVKPAANKAVSEFNNFVNSTAPSVTKNSIAKRGFTEGVKCSAIPGYSEHETGCAIDINYADSTQINTKKNQEDLKWLLNNGYKYGN